MYESKKICVCIAGWHLQVKAYADILKIGSVDRFYVSSHANTQRLQQRLAPDFAQFHEFDNLGYDWGAFQQWLDLRLWKNFDYIFFMHDDIVIKSFDLINECIRRLEKGATIVGNCYNGYGYQDWAKSHSKYYQHSVWKPEPGFKHLTVRGSFFGLSKSVLEKIDAKFEVNWEPNNIKSGNTSLVATCGKIAAFAGNQFEYLCEHTEKPTAKDEVVTLFESKWLVELVRGVDFDKQYAKAQKRKLTRMPKNTKSIQESKPHKLTEIRTRFGKIIKSKRPR